MTQRTHSHVGHLAGEVYRLLERSGRGLSVLDIAISTGMWPWDVLLALGWLMKEDKIKLHVRQLVALTAELKK